MLVFRHLWNVQVDKSLNYLICKSDYLIHLIVSITDMYFCICYSLFICKIGYREVKSLSPRL